MRAFLSICLLFVLAAQCRAQVPLSAKGGPIAAEWLVEQCDPRDMDEDEASIRKLGCTAFLRGFLEGLQNAPRAQDEPIPLAFCGEVDPEDLRLSFLRFMNDSGNDRDYRPPLGQPAVESNAGIMLFAALVRDYPCPKQ